MMLSGPFANPPPFSPLHAKAGQKEKALENLKKAETMFQEMDMDYWLVETQKVLAEL